MDSMTEFAGVMELLCVLIVGVATQVYAWVKIHKGKQKAKEEPRQFGKMK